MTLGTVTLCVMRHATPERLRALLRQGGLSNKFAKHAPLSFLLGIIQQGHLVLDGEHARQPRVQCHVGAGTFAEDKSGHVPVRTLDGEAQGRVPCAAVASSGCRAAMGRSRARGLGEVGLEGGGEVYKQGLQTQGERR